MSLTKQFFRIRQNLPMIPSAPSQSLHALLNVFLRTLPSNEFYRNEGNYFAPNASMRFLELWGNNDAIFSNPNKVCRTLVLMHGYGLGLGFFFFNYEHLLRGYNPNHTFRDGKKPVFDRIVALDWPGMGHSPRNIDFPKRTLWTDIKESFTNNEGIEDQPTLNFLLDSFHDWRIQDENLLRKDPNALKNISDPEYPLNQHSFDQDTKFEYYLAGHSMGGYLSAQYALHYPSMISGLVLISPIGLEKLPDKQVSFLANFPKLVKSFGFKTSMTLAMVRFLWGCNVTLNSIVNAFHFFGMKDRIDQWTRQFVIRRFPNNYWMDEDVEVISSYIHDLWSSEAKGEHALNSLLVPIIYERNNDLETNNSSSSSDQSKNDEHKSKNKSYAQVSTSDDQSKDESLEENRGMSREQRRRQRLGGGSLGIGVYARDSLNEKFHEISCPTLLMFGDDDWLNYKDVEADVLKWKQEGHKNLTFQIISKAGHHLYIDNPNDFNNSIIQWTQGIINDAQSDSQSHC